LSLAQGAVRPWRGRAGRLLLAALPSALLGACVEPDPYPYIEADVPRGPRVAELTIDAGGEVALQPGEGIAVAVAYAGDGRWSVTTACDTLASGYECDYDVIVVSMDDESPITDFEPVALESDDELYAPDERAVRAALSTEADTDGFELQTSPGATVRVSALLYDPGDYAFDWSDDPRFIAWFGHGALNLGAPTNPVDLTPDRP
jgi:hypothetical protein